MRFWLTSGYSVGGGFVVNEKTKGQGPVPLYLRIEYGFYFFAVDENLFYKGVDKRAVHGARLHQTHSLAEPLDGHVIGSSPNGQSQGENQAGDQEEHPPYPFVSGNSLLALTKRYNVSRAPFTL